ncbi:hypothetical protein GEMRC1_003425 [Eukaryota sp. GEM-RC1]
MPITNSIPSSLPLPSLDPTIYDQHLHDADWSFEETQTLLSLASDFNLNFSLVYDRFPQNNQKAKHKSLHTLKSRFFAVCRILSTKVDGFSWLFSASSSYNPIIDLERQKYLDDICHLTSTPSSQSPAQLQHIQDEIVTLSNLHLIGRTLKDYLDLKHRSCDIERVERPQIIDKTALTVSNDVSPPPSVPKLNWTWTTEALQKAKSSDERQDARTLKSSQPLGSKKKDRDHQVEKKPVDSIEIPAPSEFALPTSASLSQYGVIAASEDFLLPLPDGEVDIFEVSGILTRAKIPLIEIYEPSVIEVYSQAYETAILIAYQEQFNRRLSDNISSLKSQKMTLANKLKAQGADVSEYEETWRKKTIGGKKGTEKRRR